MIALLAAVMLASPVKPAPAPTDTFLVQYAATRRFRDGRPSAISLTPDGSTVLFLRSGPRNSVQDLYAFDVATGRERVLLTAGGILRGAEENLTIEERARRERQRQTARGIVSYELSRDGRHILVPLTGRLFVVDRVSGAVRELKGGAGFPIDPMFSLDASQVACVRDHDLYVIDVASGRERRLTTGGSETISNGEAEFVAQEEMDRDHGFWWSPDGRTIAYQHTDVSQVETFRIQDPAHPEKPPQEWRYPRPGKANADVTLGLIPSAGGKTTWVSWDRKRYPYLASVDWPERGRLTILVQNRTQTEEVLLSVDPVSGATRPLVTERDRAWLNLFPGMPKWLEDGASFLWLTERNGGTQLELHSQDGRLMRALTSASDGWRGDVDLDDAHGMVWVRGGSDPTQTHLFHVPLTPGRVFTPTQVTSDAGQHAATFSKDRRVFVHTFTPVAGATRWMVQHRDGSVAGEIRSVAEAPVIAPNLEFTRAGELGCHAVIVRPHDFDPTRRYPVIVSVYGGPHSQQVVKSGNTYVLQQWLADHGFIVVSADGRGTPNRGREWERAIKNDLIAIPLEDQVNVLQALGRRYAEMDLTRVGIDGWSFGGYFTVLALERRPAVFHAGIAGAPVVDWHDYDTHYTERYMGLPDQNAAGYRASSALTWAKDLTRPLLIIHGTADDNVYFFHSLNLCDALMRAGRTFELVPLAGTHQVADSVSVTQVNQRILAHFTRYLGGPSAPRAANR